MKKSYADLLSASFADIESIREQEAVYLRDPLTPLQLNRLRDHLNVLYPKCLVQKNFAYNIYMRAG